MKLDFSDPVRFNYDLDTWVCPNGHVGQREVDEAVSPYILMLYCSVCGESEGVEPYNVLNLDRSSRGVRFTSGVQSHGALVDRICGYLKPYFDTYREVYIRQPDLGGPQFRIDLVAVPKIALTNFPFPVVGVEVKPPIEKRQAQSFAWHQTRSYRDCVITHRSGPPSLLGLSLNCVALYQGRQTRDRHDPGLYDQDGLQACTAGRENIGEFVHDRWHGLALLISEEVLWSSTAGVTQRGAAWHEKRRVANAKRRQQ